MNLDDEILEWHIKTFPNITEDEQLEKLNEELLELEEADRSLFFNGTSRKFYQELADVHIACVGLRRFGSAIGRKIDALVYWPIMNIAAKYVEEKLYYNKHKRVFKNNHHIGDDEYD